MLEGLGFKVATRGRERARKKKALVFNRELTSQGLKDQIGSLRVCGLSAVADAHAPGGHAP